MIAVISVATDVHYRCVAQELLRLGRECVLIELPRLGNGARFSVRLGERTYQRWESAGEPSVDLDRVDCVWYRRSFPPRLEPEPAERADLEWALREWRDATSGAWSGCPARFVSRPEAQELAAVKPYQLSVAQRLGLRIPDTLMTNDADAARRFVREHRGRVIHKVVKTPRDRWVATKAWSEADDKELAWLYLTPTFFQERIEAPHELRVTIVGRDVFSAMFAVPADVSDARSELDVAFERHDLPDAVQADLLALMDELGLDYATIDLKRRADGSYVFLELNPQGQFLYVEMKTGLPITRRMAQLLASE